MGRPSAMVLAAAAVSILALLGGLWALRRDPAPAAALPASDAALPAAAPLGKPPPAKTTAFTAPALPAPPNAPLPSASAANNDSALDEPTLMQTLRELRSSDPNRSLQLAREGNERFKNSADAAERSWFVVKALTDLGRHDEARVEGRALLDAHHDTHWAEDVYRHLFTNPGTHPFERGYGKQLETNP